MSASLVRDVALYLLAHVAVLRRATGRALQTRDVGVAALVVLIPAALYAPALAALALVTAVCVGVAGAEALSWREDRLRIRHPERAEEERPSIV